MSEKYSTLTQVVDLCSGAGGAVARTARNPRRFGNFGVPDRQIPEREEVQVCRKSIARQNHLRKRPCGCRDRATQLARVQVFPLHTAITLSIEVLPDFMQTVAIC